MPTVTEQFELARRAYGSAIQQLHNLAGRLPPYPPIRVTKRGNEKGGCCENRDTRVITAGLEQWSEFNAAEQRAYTDGWDDMGDMDGPSWIFCSACGGTYALPDDLDWN